MFAEWSAFKAENAATTMTIDEWLAIKKHQLNNIDNSSVGKVIKSKRQETKRKKMTANENIDDHFFASPTHDNKKTRSQTIASHAHLDKRSSKRSSKRAMSPIPPLRLRQTATLTTTTTTTTTSVPTAEEIQLSKDASIWDNVPFAGKKRSSKVGKGGPRVRKSRPDPRKNPTLRVDDCGRTDGVKLFVCCIFYSLFVVYLLYSGVFASIFSSVLMYFVCVCVYLSLY